jgi:hypothetical protein
VGLLFPGTDHSMSKPQNHLMIEKKEMVIWQQEKREKYLDITKGNETLKLIALNNTNRYFQIKTNRTARNMKFRKMFYRG